MISNERIEELFREAVDNLQDDKQAFIVKFEKGTPDEFAVKFSERGFVVSDTRLSFEALENALSKNYDIKLNSGKGLMLTQVRMQKIMKYKDYQPK